MTNEYINEFYEWFVRKLGTESYRKMGVEELSATIDDKKNDLVLILNKKADLLEVESNYFNNKSALFVLSDIGVLYEKHRQSF